MTIAADPTINLNDTVPSPPANGVNVKWQASGTSVRSVSAYLPCPGGTATFLRADGTFASPTAGGGLNTVSTRVSTVSLGTTTTLTTLGCDAVLRQTSLVLNPPVIASGLAAALQFSDTFGVNDGAGIGGGGTGLWLTGTNLQFVCQAGIARTTDVRMWIGLVANTNIGPTNMPSSDVAVATFIGFRYSSSAGDTAWQCVVAHDGTARTVTSSGVAVDTKSHYFSFICNDAGSSVAFYIDGVLVATVATNYPAAGNAMGYVACSAAITTTAGQKFNFSMLQVSTTL